MPNGLGFPAKGLTGTGYEGQYFWDADIYVLPLLSYTLPQLARNFVGFRAGMLEPARRRAREVGHVGALYPWRTINGEEASTYYAAGTAQYHISADVVWAIRKYIRATGDLDVIADPGFEILIETARFWVDLGFFSERMGGEFVINGVTGPDEYTTVVDNNLYTNLMARENLLSAAEVAEWMRSRRPKEYAEVVRLTSLEDHEEDVWRRAGEAMHVPWDERERVHLQDDGFLNRERWDFAGTPAENYPLLLHFHPLEIYRHQVIKQADVVAATFLLGHRFTTEEKRRVFEYYDPLTTGDSSLSAPVQSVMATELGLTQNGVEYFVESALVDLLDLSHNVSDGIHLAAAGGIWMALVNGFGGFRDYEGDLRFQPVIPSGLESLTFKLRHRDHVIAVRATHDQVTYSLVEGEVAVVFHWDEQIALGPGSSRRGATHVVRSCRDSHATPTSPHACTRRHRRGHQPPGGAVHMTRWGHNHVRSVLAHQPLGVVEVEAQHGRRLAGRRQQLAVFAPRMHRTVAVVTRGHVRAQVEQHPLGLGERTDTDRVVQADPTRDHTAGVRHRQRDHVGHESDHRRGHPLAVPAPHPDAHRPGPASGWCSTSGSRNSIAVPKPLPSKMGGMSVYPALRRTPSKRFPDLGIIRRAHGGHDLEDAFEAPCLRSPVAPSEANIVSPWLSVPVTRT
ncbi:MAG: hypothetical protein M5U19_23005 [Microthrixaceae bacterium]|nr:hypothetical protein [Microthrixaceae bacterium]